MNVITYIAILTTVFMAGEAMWIWNLTSSYHRMSDALGRASAQVTQHRILIAELQQLIADDEDMNKCFQEEIEGKAFERAREVTYEQAAVEREESMPWIPTKNPK